MYLQKMPKLSFLDVQYNLSKRRFLKRPSRMLSRENSGLLSVYQPNIEELKQVFDKFDTNKDGKISQEEYRAILKSLGKGYPITKEVQKIFEIADMDGDGFIDFKEFVEVQKKGGGVKTMDLKIAFKAFDKDGDGKISVDEVFELLQKLGERCTLQDCRRMVRGVDTNGDGVIDMDEFTNMMTRSIKLY